MPNLNNRPKNTPNFKQFLNSTPRANIYPLSKQFINHQYSELFYLNIVYIGKLCKLTMTLNMPRVIFDLFKQYLNNFWGPFALNR